MPSNTPPPEGGIEVSIDVECYARAATVAAPVDETLGTLRDLDERGAIESLGVHVWPAQVDVDDATPDDPTVSAFERFEAWADRWGVGIRPPFELRTRTSEFTGRTRTTLVTPVVFLAVAANGNPVGLYPHSAGETTSTVGDALAALEAGRVLPPGATGSRADSTTLDGCPRCGTALVNGQGLYHCPACEWAGTANPGDARGSTDERERHERQDRGPTRASQRGRRRPDGH